MPTYNFRNKSTGEEKEVLLRISELDQWKDDNPDWEQFLTAAPSIGGRNTTMNFNAKVPDWHKDNMKEMKKLHPKGNYGTID
jgi:hypothetical protein